jgi:hypothetical protein
MERRPDRGSLLHGMTNGGNMNPLKRRVTVGIFGVALVGSACGGGSGAASGGNQHTSPPPASNSAPGPHVYEGTIQGNPSISLNCSGDNGAPGYVQRDPSTGPNIFDKPHFDDSGSDRLVHFVDPAPGGGVGWGHVGSLLATQISGNITSGPFLRGKHYKVILYCTSSQDDAWVFNA